MAGEKQEISVKVKFNDVPFYFSGLCLSIWLEGIIGEALENKEWGDLAGFDDEPFTEFEVIW